jgi:hypothetical protein
MIVSPTIKVGRVNLKPLVPIDAVDDLDTKKVLQALGREIAKRFKKGIEAEQFSVAAKKRLKEAIGIQVGDKSVTIIAKHKAFRPLLEGQKPGQMRWLTKAQRPIPIITDEGELIFRSATPRSMENGSWYHPGRSGTTYLERVRKEARVAIRERVRKELQRAVRRWYKRVG